MIKHVSVSACVRAALGIGLLALPVAALAQQAQSADDGLESVIVTGSRIVRDGFQSPTPVSVMGLDRIEERAASNIGDALNELPAFRGTQTPAAQGFSTGYVGGRVLDLRGLGTQRTLTIVDGKRFVPSTTQGTVDTNMIPSGIIERVEVVTGGASAAYGSDAVAGVVNFIVNEKMTGLKVSGEYGVSAQDDDKTTAFHFSGGDSVFGGRGHILFAVDLESNTGIGTCITRDWCADEVLNFGRPPATATPNQPQISVVPAVNGLFPIPANNILPDIRPSTIAPGGVINTTSLAGLTFNPDGSARPFVYGSLVNSLYMIGGEGEGRNGYFEGIPIKAATERGAAYSRLKYDFSDDLVGRFDLSYGHLEGVHYAGQYRNTLGTTALTIFRTNPFLPTSSNATYDIAKRMDAAGVTSFQLGRHYAEFGNPRVLSDNGALRAVAALNGKLAGTWTWDASYTYGRNDYKNTVSNNVINAKMANAFNAVKDATGKAVCSINADANLTNDDPACVPLNPFGNQINPAAWTYVTGNSVQTNVTTEQELAANVQGAPFATWAGDVSVATGLEYRIDDMVGTADAISQALGFFGSNAQNIAGKVTVKEAYAETIVPLAKDVFLAHDLDVNGAVRHTQYERNGANSSSTVSATTWKLGGTWAPFTSVRFRATKSRDIRAPNVSELYGPQTSGFSILTDPVTGLQTNHALTSGSNPDLKPEQADTQTFGVVLQPQVDGALGRLQMSADYYDITINDAIGTLGNATIVNRCYQGATELCALVTRDPVSNMVTLVKDVLLNVNKLITRGLDVEVSYKQPMGAAGSLDLRLLATFVADLKTVDTAGTLDRAGYTGLRGGQIPGIPDYTLDSMVTWRKGPLQTSLHARYIPSGKFFIGFIGPEDPGWSLSSTSPNKGITSNRNDVPSAMYFDLSGQYAISGLTANDLVVFGAINNVTDKDPPRTPGANGSGNNVLFDVTGRAYKIGLRYKF